MLSNAMVEEVRRLLAEGKLSQRAISKQMGVSRGTITSISMDRRRERVPREPEPEADQGPPARCPTCGGTVYMPCRLCRVRDAKFGPNHDRSLRATPPASALRTDAPRPSESPTSHARFNPNDRNASASGNATRSEGDRSQRLPGR